MDVYEYTTRRRNHKMTATQLGEAKKIAARIIGDKRLCSLRQGNKVRFFVADDLRGESVVTEVTHQVARVLNKTRDKWGWIIRINSGYGPEQFLAEAYDEAMGREPKSVRRI